MKKTTLTILALAFIALPLSAKDAFKLIHVADLSAMLSQKDLKLAVLDANNEKTRKDSGYIPGATLLPSYDKYDVKATLPDDKNAKLVFYCANTKCMASHAAAERALENGYKDVSVMADGIQGWAKAGKPVAKKLPRLADFQYCATCVLLLIVTLGDLSAIEV